MRWGGLFVVERRSGGEESAMERQGKSKAPP